MHSPSSIRVQTTDPLAGGPCSKDDNVTLREAASPRVNHFFIHVLYLFHEENTWEMAFNNTAGVL